MSVKDELNQALAAGREHYFNVGWREAPLSGEWAGESMGELSMQYGVSLSDQDLASEFEDGFFGEWHQEREDDDETDDPDMIGLSG